MSREKVGHTDKAPRAKSGSGASGAADNAAFRGYINLSLSDAEKAEWAAWSTTPDVWECFNAQVASGINLAVKREKGGELFVASATQRDPTSPNAGLVVTARGRDAGIALTRVLWCLVVLSRSERWEDTQPVSDPDRW
jgi:hypothetical protein